MRANGNHPHPSSPITSHVVARRLLQQLARHLPPRRREQGRDGRFDEAINDVHERGEVKGQPPRAAPLFRGRLLEDLGDVERGVAAAERAKVEAGQGGVGGAGDPAPGEQEEGGQSGLATVFRELRREEGARRAASAPCAPRARAPPPSPPHVSHHPLVQGGRAIVRVDKVGLQVGEDDEAVHRAPQQRGLHREGDRPEGHDPRHVAGRTRGVAGRWGEWRRRRAGTLMSAKLLRPRPPPRAVAHRRCAPTHRAALSPETAARLDALLATADAPGAPPAAVDAAEADAVALLRKAVEAGDVRGFGRAARVPRRQYTLADLRLNKIDPPAVLSPTDATLNGVRDKLTLFAGAGAVAWGAGTRPSAGATPRPTRRGSRYAATTRPSAEKSARGKVRLGSRTSPASVETVSQ